MARGAILRPYSSTLGIDRLYDHSTAAAHDSYVTESYKSRCLEGTRTQHVDNITAWTAHIDQFTATSSAMDVWSSQGRESAVAKSCAERTTEQARGFFSGNSVDDPTRIFTTIARQLATETDKYREVLNLRIQHNPVLPSEKLDIQFHRTVSGISRRNTEDRFYQWPWWMRRGSCTLQDCRACRQVDHWICW